MNVVDPDRQRSWLRRMFRRIVQRPFLSRVWFVHVPVILLIRATPAATLHAIKTVSRPSAQRLQHRNLFVQGRRYQFQVIRDGFRLTTTHSVRWRYRRRTAAVAVMRGTLEPVGDSITRLRLKAHIKLSYLIDVFLIPAYMGSILSFMPWSPLVVIGCVLTLVILSFIGHRANAKLEAAEMVWFVQKALEDFVPAEIMALNSSSEETVEVNADFGEEWEKFYEEHKNERK